MSHDGHHFLNVSDGFLSVICEAPEDAECRNECGEHCGAWEGGDGCDHPKTNRLDYCNVQEWMSGSGELECAAEEQEPIPVEITWPDYTDGPVWRILTGEAPAGEQP